MNTGYVTWLFAGALAASLAWNVRTACSTNTAPSSVCRPCAPVSCSGVSCTPGACSLDPTALALDPEVANEVQRVALAGCSASAELEARASERANELRREIALGNADRARALAGDISALRGRSLQECVETILSLREHLAQPDFEAVMRSCWSSEQPGE